MIISEFEDYYDPLIPSDIILERLNSDNVVLSEFNAYRYTLIIGDVCRDFIVRDGKIIIGYELKKYGVTINNQVKIRCDLPNYFTHANCKVFPYIDSGKLNSKLNTSLLIIQNMDPIYNVVQKPYGLDSKIYRNICLKTLNFDEVLTPNEILISFKFLT